jgi:hypothetical protein
MTPNAQTLLGGGEVELEHSPATVIAKSLEGRCAPEPSHPNGAVHQLDLVSIDCVNKLSLLGDVKGNFQARDDHEVS